MWKSTGMSGVRRVDGVEVDATIQHDSHAGGVIGLGARLGPRLAEAGQRRRALRGRQGAAQL